jgi:DNA-binding MarR family transcriptional regulator
VPVGSPDQESAGEIFCPLQAVYLTQERLVHDRRSIHVRLTDKGSKLRDRLHAMHERHVEMLDQTAITGDDLQAATVTRRRLERLWIRTADFAQRAQVA